MINNVDYNFSKFREYSLSDFKNPFLYTSIVEECKNSLIMYQYTDNLYETIINHLGITFIEKSANRTGIFSKHVNLQRRTIFSETNFTQDSSGIKNMILKDHEETQLKLLDVYEKLGEKNRRILDIKKKKIESPKDLSSIIQESIIKISYDISEYLYMKDLFIIISKDLVDKIVYLDGFSLEKDYIDDTKVKRIGYLNGIQIFSTNTKANLLLLGSKTETCKPGVYIFHNKRQLYMTHDLYGERLALSINETITDIGETPEDKYLKIDYELF